MNSNGNVSITIWIDDINDIRKEGRYIVIKPSGYKNKVAIKPSTLAHITSYAIEKGYLKVIKNG